MFDPEDVDEDMAQPSGDLPMLEQVRPQKKKAKNDNKLAIIGGFFTSFIHYPYVYWNEFDHL